IPERPEERRLPLPAVEPENAGSGGPRGGPPGAPTLGASDPGEQSLCRRGVPDGRSAGPGDLPEDGLRSDGRPPDRLSDPLKTPTWEERWAGGRVGSPVLRWRPLAP